MRSPAVGWMRNRVVRCPASPGETSGGRHADQAAARRFAGWGVFVSLLRVRVACLLLCDFC